MPFHFSSSLLAPGSVILPGNWGRIVRLIGPAHTEWSREQILEQVRQAEFAELLSRFDCVFFFEDAAEATHFGLVRGPRSPLILYEVELTAPDARQHIADWQGTGPYDSTDWARRYWSGDVMPGRGPVPGLLCREVLAITPLRILRQVQFTSGA